MIIIEDKVVSDLLLENKFVCDLKACKGACCVEGESGAPLEEDEAQLLEKIYPKVKGFLTNEGRMSIEKKGFFKVSKKGIPKTTLMKGGACAYVQFENGIAKCGIEKAYEAGKIKFRKPISCHLYPIRITKTEEMDFVNYEEWDICDPACKLGENLKVPVYKFLKEPIIRKYGEEFYKALDAAAKHLDTKGDQ